MKDATEQSAYRLAKIWLRNSIPYTFYAYEVSAIAIIGVLAFETKNLNFAGLGLVPIALLLKYAWSEQENRKSGTPALSEVPGLKGNNEQSNSKGGSH